MMKNSLQIYVVSIGLLCMFSVCAQLNMRTPQFPPTPTISEKDIRSDLSTWSKGMSDLHPDISHRIDLKRLEKMKSEIERSIKGEMTQLQIWRLFALINPVLRDGHNGIAMPKRREWIEKYLKGGGHVFPLAVYVDENDHLFVSKSDSASSSFNVGDEITSINGLTVSNIVRELLARTYGDTPLFRRTLVSRRFSLMYLMQFGDTGKYFVKGLSANDGSVVSADITGAHELPSNEKAKPLVSKLYKYHILDGNVGYIKASTFNPKYSDAFLEFTTTAFTAFHDAGIKSLIIDIRENGGGDDPLWQKGIMENITEIPYRHVSSYSIRITKNNADPGDVIGDVQTGDYKGLFRATPDNPIRFKGQTYILLSSFTYSSAIQFSVAAQDFGIAKIAGVETGGFSCSTGGVTVIPMEKTQLIAFVPVMQLTRPSGIGCESGIIPDIPIKSMPFQPDQSIESLRVIAIKAQ